MRVLLIVSVVWVMVSVVAAVLLGGVGAVGRWAPGTLPVRHWHHRGRAV